MQLQNKAFVLGEIENLILDYRLRNSKFIKFKPTDKELKEAIRLYKMILDDNEITKNEMSKKFLEMLNSFTDNIEEHIKLVGFMFETLNKHSDGKIPHKTLLDTAEKWGVLDYVTDDIAKFLFNKLDG